MHKRFGWRDIALLLVALASIALDQYTKHLVRENIPLYTSWAPVSWLEPFLTFTHTQNTGIAFGLFPGVSVVFVGLILVIIIAIVIYYKRYAASSWMLTMSFGLLLGGAIGNLIDRIRFGEVVDFLDFHYGDLHWPAFNVADIAITLGSVALLAAFLRARKTPPEE